ncbi:MAG: heparinase II/III family protein [Clostridia bacterium]|nr:heparinase II/III family protein [Clostridia bacterium]
MFSEFIKAHPPGRLELQAPKLSSSDCDWIDDYCLFYRTCPYPVLTASQYMAFAREGDRATWERPYFLRRRKLIAALLDALYNLQGLDPVIDGLWLICEETTWVISAHNGAEHAGVEPTPPRLLPEGAPYVDLFAAQTAMILSLTSGLLSAQLDAISPTIRRRVKDEIERRVLTPFETRDDFWWMGVIRRDLCNWTPWIVSNVMLTACLWVEDAKRLWTILRRGCAMLDRYLDCLPNDGGCDEGAGYWSMAGGALLDALELLERVTGARMNLENDEKFLNIMRFPMRAWLFGDYFMNYADCDARPSIPAERLQYAGARLGDPELLAFGVRFRNENTLSDTVEDTPQLWRLLSAWAHPEIDAPEARPLRDVWLPDLQIRNLHRGRYIALSCKGGVNAGSHNHNDCGSFIVCYKGLPEIVDAGNMTYTGKTFSEERYTLWNIRSRYHNVPQIGEFEQAAGLAHRARSVEPTPDGMVMDIAPAYPEAAGVEICQRELRADECGVTLRDVVRTREPRTLTEVFLMRCPPERSVMTITPSVPMRMEVEEVPVDDSRMAENFPHSLWRVAYSAPAATAHDITFRIERNDA